MEVKNSRCENHIKWGPSRGLMIRRFKIWPQNSNRKIFDPHSPKTAENWPSWKICQFSTFFWQKRRGMLFDYNFEARFGILSSFSIF